MSLQKNEAQEEAIKTIKGPVIVISCPGSGKTTTLVRRIKHIIDNGGNPKKILMITFANSAAADMQERYVKLYGKNPGIMFMTIHSLCFNILRIEKGYDSSSLITESQKMEFLVNQLKGNIYIDDAWEMAKTIATEISAVRNSYTPLKNFIPTGCDKELFVRVYNAYEQEKRNSGKIDFDDMLVKCEELLSTNKEIRDKWSRHFDYIQVDEYQDTNQIQKDIIYTLISRTNNLCVVGDDDQSLYSWRGADPSIMMNFSEDFPKVKVINMSTNYRSSQKIIDYADTLIKRNKKRFQKNFISFRGQNGSVGEVHFLESKGKRNEMAAIIDKIHYLHEVENYDYNEMAILFRTNKQAEIPVDMLSRAGLPFSSTEKIKTVYESYIFKDIKAYVELSLGMNYKSNLFAVERDRGLEAIIGNLYQSFDGQYIYKSVEEKAANFLYLIVKNHVFVDGNKRIAATLFIYFLEFYNILYKDNKQVIDNNTLAALTLLIAESNPKEKDILVDLVTNFLNNN